MEEILIASSSINCGIGSWNLQTGRECFRYKSCASSIHGLTCIINQRNQFIASSQICDLKTSSGSIFYWSFSKPQVEVKSFLEEPLKPLVSNSKGTYLVGGGLSGNIYLWEVASGTLLRKWRAHYRAATCLAFTDDDFLIISGSEDGSIRVWSIITMFDGYQSEQASHLYELNFAEHTLCVTDIVVGFGGCHANFVSASEDCTCKIWSLLMGKLLRSIVFPSVIDAIALNLAKSNFYAGGRDGKIYIESLNADSCSTKSQRSQIFGALSNGKAISCLAYGLYGNLLLAGSEDGNVQAWDPETRNLVRIFKLGKGPINNICVVTRPSYQNQDLLNAQTFLSKEESWVQHPLHKYVHLTDGKMGVDPVIILRGTCDDPPDVIDSVKLMAKHKKELQQQGSSAGAEMELGTPKNKESNQQEQKWKKMSYDLLEYCVNDLVDLDNMGTTNFSTE